MRSALACVIVVVSVALAACSDDPDVGPPESAATPTSTEHLLPLDAACTRIWGLFKRHGATPIGDPWEDLVAGARDVLARSHPDVVATLEPVVDAFDAAMVEPEGQDQLVAATQRGNRLIRNLAASCGQQFERDYSDR